MFIVGKSFFNETLSKFNIKTIAPLCVIQIIGNESNDSEIVNTGDKSDIDESENDEEDDEIEQIYQEFLRNNKRMEIKNIKKAKEENIAAAMQQFKFVSK